MEEIRAVITREDARLQCNFDQVEKAIQNILAEYKGAVFTEDSKVYAKKHVASLRAQKKELQDNLREEKKKYMRPWEELEARAKKLIALFDEPIDLINGQVKALEEERIRKKKELIQKIYAEIIPQEMEIYLPLARIYNPRWENATTREKTVREEIRTVMEKTRKDIDTICSMGSDGTQRALSMYKQSLDLTEAVSYINSYERQKQEILAREQERRRHEEEERMRCEEREKIFAETRAKEALEEAVRKAEEEASAAVEQAKTQRVQEVIESLIPKEDGEESLYEYRIFLSPAAKETLEMYMDSVGIEWEMIE